MTTAQYRLGLALCGLLMVLGAIGVVVGARVRFVHAAAVDALYASGVPVTATVTDRAPVSTRTRSKKRYELSYDHNGVRHVAWVGCGDKPCPEIGAAEAIRVDPADPDRFVDESGRLALTDPCHNDGVALTVWTTVMGLGGLSGFIALLVAARTRP